MSTKFTNPLDSIKIASPCKANWEAMYGNERHRFCGECKLNVYNLSGMTQREAENLILQTEGRLCVKFYRRADGSVLTKDCPVGWKAIKRKVSKTATAFASLVFTALSGVGVGNYFTERENNVIGQVSITNETSTTGVTAIDDLKLEVEEKLMIMGAIYAPNSDQQISADGALTNIDEVRTQIKRKRKR